jgi:squalene-hopene/tetraprenyl-beta-curcumene cyclase
MLALLAPLLLCVPQGPSEKDLFDAQLALLRAGQHADGHYGSGFTDTAHVVAAMALSPRAYREDDGPFVRDALAWLLQHRAEADEPAERALLALALSRAHRDRYAPVVAELLAPEGRTAAELPRVLLAPGESRSALELLLAIPEHTSYAERAAAVARAGMARALAAKPAAAAADPAATYEKGVDYLLAARNTDGVWEIFGQPEPGVTAMAARALLGSTRPAARAAAEPALAWLRTLVQPDGSIHGGRVQVYTTSVAIGALKAAGRPEDSETIERAAAYLVAVQCDEGEGYTPDDKFYGGIGYGGDLRPDLSNLQYAMEALREAGVASDDPAIQRAILFLQRTQNRAASNPETYHDAESLVPVRSGHDGGAAYYPGNTPAGTEAQPDGTVVARSYGSMTYALLKCYALAGLDRSDERVAAAVQWIQDHWTLEVNPGFDMLADPRGGFQGLYYYYETLAEALRALGVEEVVTPGGARHDWRAELQSVLARAQREDGSWVNEFAPRWWEGNPVLCTAYALHALHAARR